MGYKTCIYHGRILTTSSRCFHLFFTFFFSFFLSSISSAFISFTRLYSSALPKLKASLFYLFYSLNFCIHIFFIVFLLVLLSSSPTVLVTYLSSPHINVLFFVLPLLFSGLLSHCFGTSTPRVQAKFKLPTVGLHRFRY
jgi:hypothetical protein